MDENILKVRIAFAFIILFTLKYVFINPLIWDDLPLFKAWELGYYAELHKVAFDAGLPVYHWMNVIAFKILENSILLGLGNLISIILTIYYLPKYFRIIGVRDIDNNLIPIIFIASAVNFYSVYFIRNAWFYHISLPIMLFTLIIIQKEKNPWWIWLVLLTINLFSLTIASSYVFFPALMFPIFFKYYLENRLKEKIILRYLVFLAILVATFIFQKVVFTTSGNYANYNKIKFEFYTIKRIYINTIESIQGLVNYFNEYFFNEIGIVTLSVMVVIFTGFYFVARKTIIKTVKINKPFHFLIIGIFFLFISIFPFAIVGKNFDVGSESRYMLFLIVPLTLIIISLLSFVRNQLIQLVVIAFVFSFGQTVQILNLIKWKNEENCLTSLTAFILEKGLDRKNAVYEIDLNGRSAIKRLPSYYEINGLLAINESKNYNKVYGVFYPMNNEPLSHISEDLGGKLDYQKKVLLVDGFNLDSSFHIFKIKYNSDCDLGVYNSFLKGPASYEFVYE